MALRRTVKVDMPHVGQIPDPALRETIRLLWTRLQSVEENHATLRDDHDTLYASVQEIDTAQRTLGTRVEQITATARATTAATGTSTSTGSTTGTGDDSGSDNGQGQLGHDAAGATGHVTSGSALTPFLAGQIVGGTAQEFPALLAAVGADATRVANRYELIGRMIWHLNQAGFSASRYTISTNEYVLVIDNLVDNLPSAYRVLGYEDYTTPMTTLMLFAERSARMGPGQPGMTWPDGGTPD